MIFKKEDVSHIVGKRSLDEQNEMSFKEKCLKSTWDMITREIPSIEFKKSWNNGTGYYNGVVKEEGLPDVFKFTSPLPNNRTGIVFNLNGARICIFERFTPNGESPFVLVSNNNTMVNKETRYISDFMFLRALFEGSIEGHLLMAIKQYIEAELKNK